MPTDVQNAAPSAAASEAVLSVPTNADEYARWRADGSLPTKEAEPAAAETDLEPTKKDEPAASKSVTTKKGESKADPDPESGKQEAKKGKLSAAERAEQLRKQNDAEEQALQAELKRRAELRKQKADLDAEGGKSAADTSTAKAETKQTSTDGRPQPPVKPKWEDFKDKENGYELYEAARDEYNDKNADYKADLKLWEYKQQQQQEAAQKEFQETVKQAKERYPDFDKVIAPASHLISDDPQIPNWVKGRIGSSKVWVDLVYVMGQNASELQDFLELARTNPQAAYDQVVVTEHFVKEQLSGKKSAAKAKAAPEGDGEEDAETGGEVTRNSKGQFVKSDSQKAPEKQVTAAPPPDVEVGGRGSTPPDEVAKAAKENDFRSFRDAQNRRDLARRQGR